MDKSLATTVAAEVRAEMGRQNVSGAELARRLDVSQTYVWRRLTGETALDVADLERVAEILGKQAADFLPKSTAA